MDRLNDRMAAAAVERDSDGRCRAVDAAYAGLTGADLWEHIQARYAYFVFVKEGPGVRRM